MRAADNAGMLRPTLHCCILVWLSATACPAQYSPFRESDSPGGLPKVESLPESLPTVPPAAEAPPPHLTLSASDAPEMPSSGMVTMHLQGEVPLDALVGYIAKRLGVRFTFETNLAAQKVAIRTPEQVPVSSLWFLLGDVLKSRRLAILDTQDPQLKRIAEVSNLKGVPTGEAEAILQRNGPAGILTQVFTITYLDVQQAVQVLRPFLSEGSSLVTELADSRSLIVTDYATNIQTVNDLLRQIDRPANEIIVSYYEARFRVAKILAEQVKAMIAAESKPVAKDGQTLRDIFIEASGKHVLLAGSSDLVARRD